MAYQAKMFSVDRTVRRIDVETGHRPLAQLQELSLCVSGILRQIHCPDRSRRSIEHARTLLHSVDVSLEVKGQTPASCGKGVPAQVSAQLTAEFGRGCDASSLRYMRLFYQAFPN